MMLVLRFLHIISGIFWVGGSLFAARFIMPALKAAGPAAGPVLAELGRRRMPQSMLGAATIVSGRDFPTWMRTGMGRTLGIGVGFAIVAVLLGVSVVMPANTRMGRIS